MSCKGGVEGFEGSSLRRSGLGGSSGLGEGFEGFGVRTVRVV